MKCSTSKLKRLIKACQTERGRLLSMHDHEQARKYSEDIDELTTLLETEAVADNGFWQCKCTTVNLATYTHCESCGEWRF